VSEMTFVMRFNTLCLSLCVHITSDVHKEFVGTAPTLYSILDMKR